MKKQKCKSKATAALKERLVTKDSCQLVNARNFGTAHSRNERHHEKKMKSLREQQNKRLAKLEDEMDEVRAQQKMLKEVDETASDPRTAVEKVTPEIIDHNIGERNAGEVGKAVSVRGKEFKKQTLNVLNTSGAANERPKSVNHIAYNRMRDSPPGFAQRIQRQKSGNGFPSRTDAMPMASNANGSFLSGLLDIRVKRDASLLKHYNYNLAKGDARERRRGNTAQKESSEEPETSQRNYRENHLLNRTRGGKANTTNSHAIGSTIVVRQHAELITKHGEEAANHGHGIHVVASSRVVANDATAEKVKGCHEKRSVRFQEHGPSGKSDTEVAVRSSDDEGLEENPTEPTEKNWAQTLRKCRYLRRPKGYETPEVSIEAVFQRDVTIT